MDNKFTVITPTGDRPEPFRLCEFFINRQAIKPSQWIIVDDGEVPTKPPDFSFVDYVRRTPRKTDPPHTLPIQMIAALKQVEHDKIFIVEDDDWYAANYFEKVLPLFDDPSQPELVGQGETIYYHIPLKSYYINNNKDRASWCQTGFKSSLLEVVKKECCSSRNPFLDLRVWQQKVKKKLLPGFPPLCVGIKGLPGRKGAGIGWTRPYLFTRDRNLIFFYNCIEEDVELYQEFV